MVLIPQWRVDLFAQQHKACWWLGFVVWQAAQMYPISCMSYCWCSPLCRRRNLGSCSVASLSWEPVRSQLWFCVIHRIRLYSWESGQWMKGISSPPVLKWFVQNSRATTYHRTYGAAEVATQYSVGTDWLVSWGLKFFLSSVCLPAEHESVWGRAGMHKAGESLWISLLSEKRFQVGNFCMTDSSFPRIFSVFQLNQFFPREITYVRSKYFLVTRAKNGWWYWKMQIYFFLEAHFLQGNQSLCTFFVRHVKHVFINRWEVQQSSCSAWTVIVFIMWW